MRSVALDRPLRVGMISPYSLTLPGGVQAQILSLSRALRSQGVDVRVLGPCDGAPPEPGITPLGVSLPTTANGSVAPIAPDIPAQLRTMRALWDEDFDVLHLHEPLAPGPTMTALLFKSSPILATFHAAGGSAAYRWLGPGTRYLARRIDVRCAVSDAAEQMASEALGGTYEKVFNGVDVADFARAAPWPSEKPALFFLARHEERKGLRVLLEALQYLDDDIVVWVGGDGPETAALRSECRDPRIEWLGRISEAEKSRRLAGAAVSCIPSLRGESFGVVLLEAMAAGTPIAASALDAYERVARHQHHGLLHRVGDAQALAADVRRLLHDEALVATLVANGRARASEYSMAALARRYRELYTVCARRAPTRTQR